ncbi:MAG: glycosyl hydrolase family 28 protein [Candidatus Cryptobacteroides sp.]
MLNGNSYRTLLAAVSLAFVLTACRRPEPDPGPQVQDGSRIEIVLPQEASSLSYVLYSFTGEECISFAEGEYPQAIEAENFGERLVVLATQCPDELAFGAKTEGLPLSTYYFYPKDTASDLPRLWSWEGNTQDALSSKLELKPYTPSIELKLVGAPEELVSAKVDIEGLARRISLFDLSALEQSGSWSRSFTLTPDEQGQSALLMPMLASGEWELAIELNIAGLDLQKIKLPVSKPIAAGTQATLELDFSQYSGKGSMLARFSLVGASESVPSVWIKNHTIKEVLQPNTHYSVAVLQDDGSWKDAYVHDALVSDAPNHHPQIWNDWNNSKELRDTASFVNFTDPFDTPVTIRVTKLSGSYSEVTVRPTQYGIEARHIDNRTIELTIPTYAQRKLSVEYDGDRFHNLMVLPERPDADKPNPSDPNVIYYGPGVWNPEWISLRDNQTLYIDEGAVVYAKVNSIGNGTAIKGRGVLSGARLAHTGDRYASGYQLIETNADKAVTRQGFTVEGITVVDSPSWTFSIYRTNDVRIENTNIICWILNGDGIDLCSVDGALVKGCFIRTYDDCITLKVNHLSLDDTKNIRIEDNLIWADYAGGIVVGPESGTQGGGRIHNVEVSGCTVLDYPTLNKDYLNDDRGGLCISQYPSGGTTSGVISDISFHDIVIDNIRKDGRPISVWQKPQQGGCLMERISFSDIAIISQQGCGISTVVSNGNTIKDLTFSNVTYNGTLIQDSSQWLIEGDDIDISY